MFLAGLVAADEDNLICDLAETYGILQYRAHPARLIATLASGLRDDSRVKMRLAGLNAPLDTLLLAVHADHLTWLCTGQPGRIADAMMTGSASAADGPLLGFDSGEDFDAARSAIIREVSKNSDGTG